MKGQEGGTWRSVLRPADYLLVLVILAGGIGAPFLLKGDNGNEAASEVIVTVNRRVRYTGSLAADTLLTLCGPAGISTVEVKNGTARFTASPCRDKLCIRSGGIDRDGQWLLCLPNRVLVRIRGRGRREGPDGVAH